jgi:ParB-like chromosome segregation protein Spo0J
MVPMDKVRPHPDNPNSGDVEEIVASIEENTMYRPVWVQRSTGYILGGHHVYAACLSLGSDEVPVIWCDVDDEAALRILVGDNQIARLAIIDEGLLGPLLQRLEQSDRGLIGTGFSPTEVEQIMAKPDPIGHTVHVHLKAEETDAWFSLPGLTDAERLRSLL